MSDDSEQRPRRRRGRRDDPYTNFYAMYYGSDEAEQNLEPTRHRATAGRTGAALLAGVHSLTALLRGRAMLVLSVGLVGVGILIVGVMVSATRLGGDPAFRPSQVDASGSLTSSETPDGSSASATESGSSAATPTPGSSTSYQPIADGPGDIPPVYYPPTSAVGTTGAASSTPAGSTSSSHPQTTAHSTPPQTTTHSTPPQTSTHSTPTPPETTSNSPTPTPTPSPTKKCLIKDPVDPDHCILFGP
jgi:hypothetical protein